MITTLGAHFAPQEPTVPRQLPELAAADQAWPTPLLSLLPRRRMLPKGQRFGSPAV